LPSHARLCRHGRRSLTRRRARALQSAEVCSFFETLCGAVTQLHLTKLDNQDTQVAFVEFSTAQSADRALSCGGARLKVRPTHVPCCGARSLRMLQ
jgi:hypothetical protein